MNYGQDGVPDEEIIDLSICLERNPSVSEKNDYESVIGYFADGLYEVSNGGNYLGTVVSTIFKQIPCALILE